MPEDFDMDALWKALGHAEQHMVLSKLIANIQYHYFNALREAGFDEEQAMLIYTITMQSIGQAIGMFMASTPRPPRPSE